MKKFSAIGIGISTGGPPCLEKIFRNLSERSPAVLVVQHMPEGYTKALAERINGMSKMSVKEAQDGDVVTVGHGFIAPGDLHMRVVRDGGQHRIKLSKENPISGHRPSVDALFESMVGAYGESAIGVIMTGMGKDGVTSLKKMHEIGAYTIAQDEQSSTVFGMPKIAIQESAVDEILSLEGIAQRLSMVFGLK